MHCYICNLKSALNSILGNVAITLQSTGWKKVTWSLYLPVFLHQGHRPYKKILNNYTATTGTTVRGSNI